MLFDRMARSCYFDSGCNPIFREQRLTEENKLDSALFYFFDSAADGIGRTLCMVLPLDIFDSSRDFCVLELRCSETDRKMVCYWSCCTHNNIRPD